MPCRAARCQGTGHRYRLNASSVDSQRNRGADERGTRGSHRERPDGLVTRCIPEQPTFVTASERDVWQCLRDSLGPEDVLLANLRFTDEDKDHESDLVALMPGDGALVLEIKGGPVWHDSDGW